VSGGKHDIQQCVSLRCSVPVRLYSRNKRSILHMLHSSEEYCGVGSVMWGPKIRCEVRTTFPSQGIQELRAGPRPWHKSELRKTCRAAGQNMRAGYLSHSPRKKLGKALKHSTALHQCGESGRMFHLTHHSPVKQEDCYQKREQQHHLKGATSWSVGDMNQCHSAATLPFASVAWRHTLTTSSQVKGGSASPISLQ
jgi:hypothetical protein